MQTAKYRDSVKTDKPIKIQEYKLSLG